MDTYTNSDKMWMVRELVNGFGAREGEGGNKRTKKKNRAGGGSVF